MDCKVCGCAACYHNDCCDHSNPVLINPDLDYMEWYDEHMTGEDLPGYEKVEKMKKQRRQDKQYKEER